MYLLPDSWTWDSWFVDDGEQFHAFYLKASRALGDPDRRHRHASVGHAVSSDLRSWTEVADVLVASDGPAFDDLAIWTGSIVCGPDGLWRFFYTACSRERPEQQRISIATSSDLMTWNVDPGRKPLEADATCYEKLGDSAWYDEAWRDPWVFQDPAGHGWHMLITARAREGALRERGVIGHATSPDLETWQVEPALSAPGAGFGQLEVPQVAVVDGRAVLVFSCLDGELSDERRASDAGGGIWTVPIDSLTGPYDISRATRLTDSTLYAGRLVQDRAGAWQLLAFRNRDSDGHFVGGLIDPLPVSWIGDRLSLTVGTPGALSAPPPERAYR
ncbi:glycosyl hydrolase family 32 (plasmid) [Cellulomonas sp. WB94]|uniref:glycosyl hydrolase family 32 n=1 Tax=Cellulomonas sp. WB94 TaxID=2173174 RepID=UPI000D5854D2|nr:glycosyl hydrolase family 32 [Cellulomonas sp. WB94]PVU84400.1 glycosyl hydrolase family 32 [Cellulomonas sp. WB94]